MNFQLKEFGDIVEKMLQNSNTETFPGVRIEFEQTVSHMNHAPDFNIPLPSDFDMSHYMNLDRVGRIDYAEQKLSREIIISYQNEIGKSMSPLFGPKKRLLRGSLEISGFDW